MISNHRSAGTQIAVSPPDDGLADRVHGAIDSGVIPASAECVGPIPVPTDVMCGVAKLAEAVGADAFVPLAVCAGVLVGQLSPPASPRRARLIQGAREVVTSSVTAGAWDPSVSFRTAMRRAADARLAGVPDAEARLPVEVTLLISPDSSRLYAERMTSAADAPLAQTWAQSYLRLLSAMAHEPDVPLAAHRALDDLGDG